MQRKCLQQSTAHSGVSYGGILMVTPTEVWGGQCCPQGGTPRETQFCLWKKERHSLPGGGGSAELPWWVL